MQNMGKLLLNLNKNKPYLSEIEHLYESLTVLDMFIYKALTDEDFDAGEAWDYVNQRVQLTLELDTQGVILPLYAMIHYFDLNAFEYFCMLLALAPYVDEKYEKVFYELTGKKGETSLDFAIKLFEQKIPLDLDNETLLNFYREDGPARVLLGVTPEMSLFFTNKVKLKPNLELLNIIFNRQGFNRFYEMAVSSYTAPEEIGELAKTEPFDQFSDFMSAILEGSFTTLFETNKEEKPKKILCLNNEASEFLQHIRLNTDIEVVVFDTETALNANENIYTQDMANSRQKAAIKVLRSAAMFCSQGIKTLNCSIFANFSSVVQEELLSTLILKAFSKQDIICLDNPWEEQEKDILFLLKYIDLIVIV